MILPAIGLCGEIIVLGRTLFLAVATTAAVTKIMQKVKAITEKKEDPQKCDYCGNTKFLGNFWD